ncbi:hypothetical protein F5050DRAFT_1739009 [Lentinula boryana]|uniref:Uncharacterized protein n=1 Tax=Lentinula boryana TaxID=40481 RepID=A0ABQ8QKR7_9AGAR|nr:hypothetical protein F5050DRAFT_1739009 [Lentinula boryana]
MVSIVGFNAIPTILTIPTMISMRPIRKSLNMVSIVGFNAIPTILTIPTMLAFAIFHEVQ